MNTVYIIGDSTVDDNTPPFRGWGWAFPRYVREGVTVKNHGKSGCSSRSFRELCLFEPIEKELSEGDLLLIQFGHNDEKDDERHTDPDTTYKQRLWEYCDFAYSKGAFPVLITPVSRRFFVPPASLLYTHGEYPRAMRELAKEKNVPLCDLKADSRKLYLELGPDKAAELFVRLQPGENKDFPDGHDDKTHFNAFGAERIAELVAQELRQVPTALPFLKQ